MLKDFSGAGGVFIVEIGIKSIGHELRGTGARAPSTVPTSNCLIIFLVPSEPHKLWHWSLCCCLPRNNIQAYSFFTIYCMNFMMFLWLTLKLFSLSFVPLYSNQILATPLLTAAARVWLSGRCYNRFCWLGPSWRRLFWHFWDDPDDKLKHVRDCQSILLSSTRGCKMNATATVPLRVVYAQHYIYIVGPSMFSDLDDIHGRISVLNDLFVQLDSYVIYSMHVWCGNFWANKDGWIIKTVDLSGYCIGSVYIYLVQYFSRFVNV